MNPNLYASSEEIKRRVPLENNAWLSTIAVSVPTIFGKYMAYGDSLGFKKDSLELKRSMYCIDDFLGYLDKVREGLKLLETMAENRTMIFHKGATDELNAFNTITLLSNASDNNYLNGAEAILDDLSGMLNNVKNKNIKNPVRQLKPYFHLFNALSDMATNKPIPLCRGLVCTCGMDCE